MSTRYVWEKKEAVQGYSAVKTGETKNPVTDAPDFNYAVHISSKIDDVDSNGIKVQVERAETAIWSNVDSRDIFFVSAESAGVGDSVYVDAVFKPLQTTQLTLTRKDDVISVKTNYPCEKYEAQEVMSAGNSLGKVSSGASGIYPENGIGGG